MSSSSHGRCMACGLKKWHLSFQKECMASHAIHTISHQISIELHSEKKNIKKELLPSLEEVCTHMSLTRSHTFPKPCHRSLGNLSKKWIQHQADTGQIPGCPKRKLPNQRGSVETTKRRRSPPRRSRVTSWSVSSVWTRGFRGFGRDGGFRGGGWTPGDQ